MVYLVVLAWILIWNVITKHLKFQENKRNKVYVTGVFAVLFGVSALRYGIGFDYFRYEQAFNIARANNDGEIGVDIGYNLLLKGLTWLLNDNRMVFAALALMCLVPVAYFIYKYSSMPWMSCWLYVTMLFYFNSLNFIRQSLALSIMLLAWPLLKNKKLGNTCLYILVSIIAMTIHTSAIVMVPVAVLMWVPLNNLTLVIFIFADLCCMKFAPVIMNGLCLRNGEYYFMNYHVDSIYMVGIDGWYLIMPILIAVISIGALGEMRKHYKGAEDLVKLMLGSLFVWSFVTQYFIVERFSLFMWAFMMLAIPYAITSVKMEENSIMKRSQGLTGEVQNEMQKAAVKKQNKWEMIETVVLTTSLIYFVNQLILGAHGVMPYQTWIFK